MMPSRLKAEMAELADALVAGTPVAEYNEVLAKHGDWAEELMGRYTITAENVEEILHKEIGLIFAEVLEDAGVYKLDEAGRAGFLRFMESVQ